MNRTTASKLGPELRLLVAIASYGDHHLEYLKRAIRLYQDLPLKVHVVVLSEAPKDLGPGVEVAVGLPSSNPWSLPFAHKPLFARNLDNYDLFAYSEDDIGVTPANIEAFLRATPELGAEEIAGFLLYEKDQAGRIFLPNFHGPFHWKPETVRRRGPYTVAEFSNEHSAYYLLTRDQLKRAIASGGFLREPYEGRHDMLCAAATDPYTHCGFRKAICISEPQDFLLHHLPNRYVGKVGIPLETFQQQIDALLRVGAGAHPACTLCEVETKMPRAWGSKSYYEKADEPLWQMVPQESRTVLSVGCGWGATELKLKERGKMVTALPLDSVIGVLPASHGIEVVCGSLAEALGKLRGRSFDCVLISDLLHLVPEPWQLLGRCAELVQAGGVLVVANPNFERLPWLARRLLGTGEYRKLRRYAEGGVHPHSMRSLRRHLHALGFRVSRKQWFDRTPHLGPSPNGASPLRRRLGRFVFQDWIVQARRQAL